MKPPAVGLDRYKESIDRNIPGPQVRGTGAPGKGVLFPTHALEVTRSGFFGIAQNAWMGLTASSTCTEKSRTEAHPTVVGGHEG